MPHSATSGSGVAAFLNRADAAFFSVHSGFVRSADAERPKFLPAIVAAKEPKVESLIQDTTNYTAGM